LLTRNNRLIIIGVILLFFTSLMYLNVDKDYQYSVDELMESPEDFKNDDVHLRGEVVIGIVDDGNNLFLLSGEVEEILIDHSSISLPDGFSDGLTISVKGKLVFNDGIWFIQAKEIQTGCPSKYEAEQ
jgi:cytochrome c-type biogenesis protein CcmE